MKLALRGYQVYLEKYSYVKTYQTRIDAFDCETGECITTLTSNLIDEEIPKDHIVVKNYSENEGILNELISQGIVEKPSFYITKGFVTFPVCKLLIQ